jgi:hypothetical protein
VVRESGNDQGSCNSTIVLVESAEATCLKGEVPDHLRTCEEEVAALQERYPYEHWMERD